MKEAVQLKKTSLGSKVAYSFGQITDSAPFNLFFVYFLFFFTDIAGLNPTMGGVVSLVVILWDAAVTPIVGYTIDRTNADDIYKTEVKLTIKKGKLSIKDSFGFFPVLICVLHF